MNGLQKICEKPPFLGIFSQKGPIFDSSWPKWAKRNFFKKAIGTFLARLQALTSCKISEKVMNGFRETASRTDVIPYVSNDFVERPKKLF